MAKPTIRFRGFDDEWEQRKVSEIAMEKLSNGIMNNQSDDETGVKHINVINMYDTDKIHPEKLTFSNYDEEAVKKCNVEFGDIFLTRSSLKPEGIAEANVLLDSGRFVYDDHLIRLKINKEKYDPFFVKLNLSGNAFKRQFIVKAKTTAFTTIGQEDISECLGFFPKKEEQQQIGEYFMVLDHLITLHQRKCEEVKKLKKNMLQKMFPQDGTNVPEIRFDGFTDVWEQRKLGDLANRITRKNQDLVSELPLTISAQYGLIDQNEFFDKRVASKDVSGYYLIENGEFAYNKSTSTDAPWGVIKRLDRYENGVLSTLYIVFGIKDNALIDSDFLVSYYSTNLWHKGIHEIAAEGARNHGLLNITPADFFETKLIIPQDVEEQHKIGKYFIELDNLITLHQRKCDELQKLKKFMLENMFA